MPSTIAVIGQSNAILSGGFVHHLAAHPDVTIGAMGRLGASPSILLPYFATPDFFEGQDFAIFDLAISDQGFLWAQAIDPYLIARWLELGIARAHAAGCIPILLAIPHRAVIGAPDAPLPLLQQLYRSVALRNGALCLDLLPEIARRAALDSEALGAIYSDPDHLTPAFAAEVAAVLAERIAAIAADPPQRVATLAALPAFDRVPIAAVPDARSEWLSSSLLSADFALLDEGEALSVPVGAIERIEGVLLDRIGSQGMLAVEGEERLVKAVGTPPDSAHGFVAQILPLLGTGRDRNGAVTLSAAPADAAVTEPSWQSVPAERTTLRVAELLVQRTATPVAYTRPRLPERWAGADWFRRGARAAG